MPPPRCGQQSRDARPVVQEALRRALGREPSLAELYTAQAVTRFDGGYGNWHSPPHGPEASRSNNWGAVQDAAHFNEYVIWSGITNPSKDAPEVAAYLAQAAPASPLPDQFFYGTDYHVDKGWFRGPYKVYATPVDGALHVVRLLHRMGVLDVANQPGATWTDVARRMREQHYYLGYGDAEQAIRDYARNLRAGGTCFAYLFGESDPLAPVPASAPAPAPARNAVATVVALGLLALAARAFARARRR